MLAYMVVSVKVKRMKFKKTPTIALHYNIKLLQLKRYNSDMSEL